MSFGPDTFTIRRIITRSFHDYALFLLIPHYRQGERIKQFAPWRNYGKKLRASKDINGKQDGLMEELSRAA